MREIYLDNSATTPLCDSAVSKMTEAMGTYGNPSSLHSIGLAARKLVDEARNAIGVALGTRMLKPGQIVFTSSGTEANNLAVCGCAYSKKRRIANKIITTDSEHSSVDNLLKKLEDDGFEIVRIPTRCGVLDLDDLEKKLDKNVLLVTMMLVNNETGALYDIEKAFSMVKLKCPDAVTHCDAVQGFMKVKFTPNLLNADLVSISAHKIHGPKGVGVLYINADVLKHKKMAPIIFGGGQETGLRSGTENVIGISGFGAAVREAYLNLDENISHMSAVREFALLKLSALDIRLNIPLGNVAPHIINFTLPDIKSETMLHYLSSEGIYVSSGSACSSHSVLPSRALTAFGLSPSDADCSLRVSLSKDTTEADIDALAEYLQVAIRTLVRIKR